MGDRQYRSTVPKDLTVLEGAVYSPSRDLPVHEGPTGHVPIATTRYRCDIPMSNERAGDIDPRLAVEAKYADYLLHSDMAAEEGIPHCDDLVLHAPGECRFCDDYPKRQALRRKLHIGFTNQGMRCYSDLRTFPTRQCPAEVLRPADKINRWGGNVADERTDEQRKADSDAYWREVDRQLFADPVEEHAFNRAVRITDEKRAAICGQRGGEYQDTWAVENVHTPRLDAVLRILADRRQGWGETVREAVDNLTPTEKRLIVVAALCDVKLSRWIGEFKEDTAIDHSNYEMALTTWLGEYLGR